MPRAGGALVVGFALALTGRAGRYFQDEEPSPAPPQHRIAAWPWQEHRGVDRADADRCYSAAEISTGVPARTRSNNSTRSAFRIRMQPIEPGLPSSIVSGVPWI